MKRLSGFHLLLAAVCLTTVSAGFRVSQVQAADAITGPASSLEQLNQSAPKAVNKSVTVDPTLIKKDRTSIIIAVNMAIAQDPNASTEERTKALQTLMKFAQDPSVTAKQKEQMVNGLIKIVSSTDSGDSIRASFRDQSIQIMREIIKDSQVSANAKEKMIAPLSDLVDKNSNYPSTRLLAIEALSELATNPAVSASKKKGIAASLTRAYNTGSGPMVKDEALAALETIAGSTNAPVSERSRALQTLEKVSKDPSVSIDTKKALAKTLLSIMNDTKTSGTAGLRVDSVNAYQNIMLDARLERYDKMLMTIDLFDVAKNDQQSASVRTASIAAIGKSMCTEPPIASAQGPTLVSALVGILDTKPNHQVKNALISTLRKVASSTVTTAPERDAAREALKKLGYKY